MIRSALFVVLTAAAPAIAGTISDGFEPGFYRITPIDPASRASEKAQSLCLLDAQPLLRLHHARATGCHDQFVQPGQDRTVVTYSCAAQGWGRTELRRETPSLYQLDTQGISGNAPFAMRAEARRIGNCPGAAQNVTRR